MEVNLDGLADDLVQDNVNPNEGADDTGGDNPSNDGNDTPSGDDSGNSGDDSNDNLNIVDLLPTLNENQALSDEIISNFKGAEIDEEGNVLDSEGKVIASAEDVNKFINEDEVLTDDAGNQIDAEGNILKSAFDIAAEETTVNAMHKNSGVIIADENGNPKIYEDTEAGFEEMTNDIVDAKLQQAQQMFFNQNRELAEVSKHILSGGTLEDFQQPVDYDSIDLTKLSATDKQDLVRKSLETKGLPKEQVDSMIDLFVAGNSIDSQLPMALTSLKESQAQIEADRDAQYQQMLQQQQMEIEGHWNKVAETVQKGDLGKIKVPDAEKQAFIDYMSLAVDNDGNSQEAIDRQKQSMEDKLAISYLLFKGGNLDSLVKNKVQGQKIMSLKEKLKASQRTTTPVNDASRGITSGGNNDVSIDKLLG